MLGKVFKAYDIRALYPAPLNENTAWKIGYGTARFLLEQAEAEGETDPMMRHIVIGKDMRPSSPALSQAISEGIQAYGANVIDLGMVDTPFIYFAVNYLDCAGGIQVTASHNPINYNGFKISGRNAIPIGEHSGLEDISVYAAMADPLKAQPQSGKSVGRYEERNLWAGYRKHVLQFLKLTDKKLKIVIDASNGMAGTMIPQIFNDIEQLEIVKLYFENDKHEFVHEPNPLIAANLKDLQTTVLEVNADFGICFDGDADRGIFVDEKANIIGCDHLTALLARYELEQNPGATVVYDLRSSHTVVEEIIKAGGKPLESRVGHVFIKQMLREFDAVIGGELSGHFYFRDNFYADSGAIVLATMVSVLSKSDRTLSELIHPFARYAQSGEINFENNDKDGTLREIAETYLERGDVSYLDGITIDCFEDEGWWCNIRKSNTEPLLRLNLEAREQWICEKQVAEIAPLLGQRVDY